MEVQEEELVMFLKLCVENSETEWESLFSLFECVEIDFSDIDKILNFTDSVMQLLIKFDINHPAFISRVIDFLSTLRDSKFKVDPAEFSPNVLKDLFVAQMTSSIRRRNESHSFFFCPQLEYEQVARAFYTGDVNLMRFLVRNGISYDCPQYQREEVLVKLCTIMLLQETYASDQEAYLGVVDFTEELIGTLAQRNLFKGSEFIVLPDAFTGIKRQLLILTIIKLMIHQQRIDMNLRNGTATYPAQNYVKCLRLYFQTIPEPFVTVDEAKPFMKTCSSDEVTGDNIVEYMSGLFKENFPESNRDLQPRSLKHICRCQVRFDLRKIGSLPYEVKRLFIPHTLKDYLLSDSDEFTN